MKRVLLGGLCLMVLAFGGCASIHQSNRFVVMPEPQASETPLPTVTPELTLPPVVQIDGQPAERPIVTNTPAPTPEATATPAPAQSPEGSPGGFNG